MMITPRFEKFEMKYGYLLPNDFKKFMIKYGGDTQFGSCRFDYPDNIINNLLRIPGKMDFHLLPFGDIGNGDYYCFYRYGTDADEYYVGIWLHETENFVILASSFKSFMYKCLLDDCLAVVIPYEEEDQDKDEPDELSNFEAMQRASELSEEFHFDIEKARCMKNEFDYHRLLAEMDGGAIQSICYLGKMYLQDGDTKGIDYLDSAIKLCSFYTAPYYIAAKGIEKLDGDSFNYFKKSLKTSLVLTGYSYWEEDYLEIPEDVHREIALFCDEDMKNSSDYLEKRLYSGEDPYDYRLRLDMAMMYEKSGNIQEALIEYNNAIFCVEDILGKKEILLRALKLVKDEGIYYLRGIMEHDIKSIR